MFLLLVLLALLAVPRAARLVTADKITEPVRDWIVRSVRDDEGFIVSTGRPKLLYFITCPWCTSIWIGAITATLLIVWPEGIDGGVMDKAVLALMLLGASSEAAGFMALFEDRLDRDCCRDR